MSSISFIILLITWSSASAWDAYCPCNAFLQQVPIQSYYNQPLGPFLGTAPPIQFMGNAPPTVAPQAGGPAAAGPPLGPTPDCPCMTTPNPNTTPQPGSPEDAKEEIHTSIDELSKEKEKEAKDAADKAGADEVEELKRLRKEAKDKANGQLSKVGDEELHVVESNWREQSDSNELRLDGLRRNAKLEGTLKAEAVTQATEEVADQKAQTVVGNIMSSTKVEIAKSEERAVELTRKAKGMVHEARLSAERVENAAKEAQMAALKEPRHRAAEAQRQSIKAGESVMILQPEALQSQKIAEAAAAVAWEAQKTARKALEDSKAAVKASESAYQDALVNKENLVKLKKRAEEASKQIKVAQSSATNAVQAATGAINDIKAYGSVT